MKGNRITLMGLVLAGLAASAQPAQATDGYFSHGYGMKSLGMGGAGVAIAQEPFGGAVNPGAMTFLDGNMWEVGLTWFNPQRSASRTGSDPYGLDGSSTSGSDNFFIPEFAVNWRYSPTVSFGLSVYGNGGMNTDYGGGEVSAQSACAGFNPQPGPYNLLCGNGKLGVDLMQLMIAPYVSWQFVPGHSIGIAPIIAYQRFEANGLQAFDNPFLSTSPGNVTNRGHDDSWGVGVRVGYMGKINQYFAVGLAYASKVDMGEFDNYKGLFAQSGGFDIPSSLLAGVTITPDNRWTIALDFERIFYDDTKSVSNRSALIYNCAGGDSSACMGGSNGAGFGWRNIDVWKLGVQYKLNDAWTLRAGYNHTDNPIEPADVTFNIIAPGVMKNHYTLGTTWSIDKMSELTGAFMYAPREEVTGASLFNGFVNGQLPPGAPPMNASETIGMRQYELGIAYQRRF